VTGRVPDVHAGKEAKLNRLLPSGKNRPRLLDHRSHGSRQSLSISSRPTGALPPAVASGLRSPTVIAFESIISGVFSLTQQAVSLASCRANGTIRPHGQSRDRPDLCAAGQLAAGGARWAP